MAKITIEFDDEIMAGFLDQVAEQAASSATTTTDKKPAGKKEDKEPASEETFNAESIKEMCNKLLDLTDKAKVKEVLSEFNCTTVSKATKLEGDDLQDCGEALQEAIAEAESGGSGEDDEVTVEAVKVAVQAFSKKNGKDDTKEILEDFGINSVRGLNKLSQEDLEELYAEVCE